MPGTKRDAKAKDEAKVGVRIYLRDSGLLPLEINKVLGMARGLVSAVAGNHAVEGVTNAKAREEEFVTFQFPDREKADEYRQYFEIFFSSYVTEKVKTT